MFVALLNSLLDLKRPTSIEVDGRTYFTSKDSVPELAYPPLPTPVVVNTLTGFVDAVKAKIDGLQSSDVVVLVDSFDTVQLISTKANGYGARQEFIRAAFKPYGGFQFGEYMDPETFIIRTQAGFIQTENLDKLVALASSLTAQNSVQTVDDGITQVVTVQQGAVTRGTVPVTPRWPLQARRTFTEAGQPTSEFLIRIKGKTGEMPSIALFEIDGGAWKNAAMLSVSSWLREQLPGFTHLA